MSKNNVILSFFHCTIPFIMPNHNDYYDILRFIIYNYEMSQYYESLKLTRIYKVCIRSTMNSGAVYICSTNFLSLVKTSHPKKNKYNQVFQIDFEEVLLLLFIIIRYF